MACGMRLQTPQCKPCEPAPFRRELQALPLNGLINWLPASQNFKALRWQSYPGTLPGAAEPDAHCTREYHSAPQHRPAAAHHAPVQQAHGGAAHRAAAAPQLGRMHQLPVAVQPPAAAPASGVAADRGAHAGQQAARKAAHAPPGQQQILPEGGAEGEAPDQQQAKASLAAAPQPRLPASNEVTAAAAAGSSRAKVHLGGFGSQNEESPSQGSQDSRSEC